MISSQFAKGKECIMRESRYYSAKLQGRRTAHMRVNRYYIHRADKERIYELERRKLTKDLYTIGKERIRSELMLINNC